MTHAFMVRGFYMKKLYQLAEDERIEMMYMKFKQ